jgi:alpha-L-fucosidase
MSLKEVFQKHQRQVHLDFHTSPFIPDVAADFDAEEFVSTFQRAHVNSVTVFAKCHHGMCYYPTK